MNDALMQFPAWEQLFYIGLSIAVILILIALILLKFKQGETQK